MTQGTEQKVRINVQKPAQVPQAATVARRFAADNAYPSRAQWEIATVAAELASNMVKHAGGGVLTLTCSPSTGITLVAQDEGTFIGDPDDAMEDGYSRGKMRQPGSIRSKADPPDSQGAGLGAVWRLSDQLDIELLPEGGTRVTVHKLHPKGSKKP